MGPEHDGELAGEVAGEYVVVLPVKPTASGKSRLRGLADSLRRDLAEAFAIDTATACLAARRVARVVVVTDDDELGRRLTGLGCSTLREGPTRGLNQALRLGAREAERRWPDLAPVALCADLPALRVADLDSALDTMRNHDGSETAWFVTDADGTGTTMYSAPAGRFAPSFGEDSRRRHAESGARDVPGDLPSLRRDVDDLDDLRAAARLGVGRSTDALVHALNL